MARTAPCELVRLVYTMPGVAESIVAIPIECISSEALKAAKLNFSPRSVGKSVTSPRRKT